MSNSIISAREEQFRKECKVINLTYEYPGYKGIEEWAIITNLSEEELSSKYSEQVAKFIPYIVLSASFGQVRDDYIRNENKHHMRAVRNGHAFDFSEDTEEHHIDISYNTLEDDILANDEICRLREAIMQLKPIQRERLVKFFFEGKSSRVIAKEEGVAYSAVDKSIAAAIKNLKNFLE